MTDDGTISENGIPSGDSAASPAGATPSGSKEARSEPAGETRPVGGNGLSNRRLSQLLGVLFAKAREPVGPFRATVWRSPIRGPWLTSVFGAILLVGIPVEFVTGLVSYDSYNPRLGHNNPTPHTGILSFYLFNWVSGPQWLFRVTEGIHIGLGLVLTPVLLAKLWSIIPKLFDWPPVASVAKALERLSLVLIVGGAVFEFVTGIMNIDYDYSFKFSFYQGHFLGAWLFMTGFAIHVGLKFPTMVRSLRSRRLRTELRTSLADTVPELSDDTGLVAVAPAPPTISRRGALALVGGSSMAVLVLTVGQTLGGGFRRVALLAPRGRSYGSGPNDFQVNITATTAGIRSADTGLSWRLALSGTTQTELSRSDLLGMDNISASMPIACVEGWATVEHWSGVRLTDLARLVGVDHPTGAYVQSLQKGGANSTVTLAGNQVRAGHSMLALRVNGVDLSLDHGYPARLMLPAAPGVHTTKWVASIHFFGAD
jgi:DMSO/TMAO reductase YedYZ molybdopterin-dependent catalytic subunit